MSEEINRPSAEEVTPEHTVETTVHPANETEAEHKAELAEAAGVAEVAEVPEAVAPETVEAVAAEAVVAEVEIETVAEASEAASDKEETKTRQRRSKPVQSEEGTDEDDVLPVLVEEEEEFDWDRYEGRGGEDGTRGEMERMYEATLGAVAEHQVVMGRVVAMNDRETIIDIDSKSEGVVSLNEFRYNPELKIGDEVEVLVDKHEDKNGQLVLSHRKARQIKAWDRVNDAFGTEEIVTGFVKCRTKGGMIVDVFGIEAFLPGSQIDVKPIRDYDIYVNKTMEFKIVKINQEFKNVVVSHKALIEADLEEQKKEIIGKLEKGQVLEGVVKNITSYGVFVDLGGVDGLVHITDLSWSRVSHPSELLELDQRINVVILDFDEGKTRIQLGIKQLQPHPWEQLDKELKAGDVIKGKVVVIADYGAFVEVIPGVEGLVHVSEMSWSTHLRSAQDFVKVGQEIECVVLGVDLDDRKLSLGIKQLTPDPWSSITTKYPVGSQHKGTVRNFTNFGVFVELEEGIDGLIHISDLSWTKKVKHPSEFTSVGSVLDIQVLEIDTENRKLSLGHKQVQENPWEVYATILEEGSMHSGKLLESFDKGGTVLLENLGIEAFAPAKQLVREDGTPLKVGDVVDFRVIEFNPDNRRVVVSHSKINRDNREKQDAKESAETESVLRKVQGKVERSTLGDFDALSQLKAELEAKEEQE
ncbi:30S ribosomal protein S1 [bacterium]|nr:30S ribosomal protein S1 [bacterium]